MTFRDYILRRSRIDRGRQEALEFIAFAMSREDILSSATLSQIERLLRREAAPDRLLEGARSAWRSYRNLRWRRESAQPASPMKATLIERRRETVGVAVRTDRGYRFFAARSDFAHLEGRHFRRLASLYEAVNRGDAPMLARRAR